MSENISGEKDMFRNSEILTGDAQITTNPREADTFVVYAGKVAVGGSRLSHSKIAWSKNLYYPSSKDDRKKVVDDGGQIYDDGEVLVIPPYITKSTWAKKFKDAIWAEMTGEEDIDLAAVKKDMRKETASVISNITGRKVKIEHDGGTSEIISY